MNINRDRLRSYQNAPPLSPPRATTRPPLNNDFRRPSTAQAPPPATASANQPPANTNVTINISMPKFKRPQLPAWPWKKLAVYAAVVVGLLVLSLAVRAGVVALQHQHQENAAKHRLDMIQQRQNPTFTPLTPADKPQVAKTAAYDSKRDSYSYSDTLKGLSVIVSQQPMPTDANADTLAKIAKSMDATTPIIAGRDTAYLASSAAGAQTVVLGHGSLLIFVQSAFTHSTDDWIAYLDTLQS